MKDFEQNGIVVVNKPKGMTSHDVVSSIRRIFKMRQVGHAGTLDPLATGVLVVLLGRSTKLFNKFQLFDKAYRATLLLGQTTDTADIEGKVIAQKPYDTIAEGQIREVFQKFMGETEQVPPMVSALKVGGQRLYKLARKGIKVDRQKRKVRIDRLELTRFCSPHAQFYLECSKGTYVRQLAEDVGEILGCGACITQIERTKVGPFRIEDSFGLENVNESSIRQWSDQLLSS
ncbi:MAG: tRNA pseudouridine(55) synthase TruB [Candidatus Omnitrophota bacterium]